ncbi:MAG: MerR family transcriptional regulator [Lachnospiraceae bacterium]|nr:MerR family transcriptional regulator [Lachnospiraceae bacterium]
MSTKKDYFTSGELAKMSGVSYKTIRYYVEKGLLRPEKMTESGYKLFGESSVRDLEKIIMLKYLDFDLNEIKRMLHEGNEKLSFEKQEQLLKEKMVHLDEVQKVVREIRQLSGDDQWEKMLEIMQMSSRKEEIQKQYIQSDNLESRINIHAYSTSKESWYEWLFQKFELAEGMKVLDVGCGNAAVWAAMYAQIPSGVNVMLLDGSAAMLAAARENLMPYKNDFEKRNIKFTYREMNACELSLKGAYHRIMANHMLYHIPDQDRVVLLKTMAGLLEDGGRFLASTVGRNHMREIFELMATFDQQAGAPVWMSEGFCLENGQDQLIPYFSHVKVFEQKNDLLVPNPMAVYNYLRSLPGDIHQITVKNESRLKKYLREIISEEKPLFIQKKTGVFLAWN